MSNSASIAAAKKRRGGGQQATSVLNKIIDSKPSINSNLSNPRSSIMYSREHLLREHDIRLFNLEKFIKKHESNITQSNNNSDESETATILNNLIDINNEIGNLKISNDSHEKNFKTTNTSLTNVKASLLLQINNLSKELEGIKKNIKLLDENVSKSNQISCDIKEMKKDEENKEEK